MAIAFDAAVGMAAPNTTDTTLTWTHTVTGSNTFLIVGVLAYSLVAGADIVTGVTCNSVAMTRLNIQQQNSANYQIYSYYLYAPTTGSVVVTCSAAPGFGAFWGVSGSYTGVLQSGFPDAQAKGTAAGGADVTGTVTTVADNAWTVMVNGADDGPTSVAGTGTTKRVSNTVGILNRGEILNLCDSNSAKTPAGSVSVVMDIGSGALESSYIVASVAPTGGAAATVTPTPQLLSLMVG